MESTVRKIEEAADRPGPAVRPDSSNPITVRLSGRIVDGEKKRLVVNEEIPKGSRFEVYSDEGEGIGGTDSAPSPLSYFASGIAFCLLTQFSQYGKAHRLGLDDIEIEQTIRFSIEGSWLGGNRGGDCVSLDTLVVVQTDEPAERVLEWAAASQRGCFAHQSLHDGIDVQTRVVLNGEDLGVI